MPEKKFVPTVGLRVWTERNGGYFHIHVAPVCIGPLHHYERNERIDREWCSFGDNAYDAVNGLVLGSLRISSQGGHGFMDTTDKERKLYSFTTGYSQLYSLDLHRAKAMAKTLEAIERRVNKLRAKYGHESKFSQLVGYVADAIGAVEFRVERKERERRHHNEHWRHADIKDGLYAIDRLEYEWVHEEEIRAEEQRREQAQADYEREQREREAQAVALANAGEMMAE